MTRPALYVVPRHKDAVRPESSATALLAAQIAHVPDDSITRTVQRLCERMDEQDALEAKRQEIRRAVERDLRAVEARISASRSDAERRHLMRLRDRARAALKGGE